SALGWTMAAPSAGNGSRTPARWVVLVIATGYVNGRPRCPLVPASIDAVSPANAERGSGANVNHGLTNTPEHVPDNVRPGIGSRVRPIDSGSPAAVVVASVPPLHASVLAICTNARSPPPIIAPTTT